MYFPYFMAYMGLGLAVTLPVFAWALKTGQFKEQGRARYLPIEPDDEGRAGRNPSKFAVWEVWTLMFMAILGLAACAATVVFSLIRAN